MNIRCGALVISMTTALAAVPGHAAADARSDAEAMVSKAEASFRNFMSDPNMQWFRDNVREAKGLLIVPEQLKGGFIIGGSGGSGVLLGRRSTSSTWSHPAFYTMGAASVGLQIGAQLAEVVLMIMTDRGLDAMYSAEFKLGADVSVAAGPVGAGAQAATADVLAFARTKGVFGGVSVEGAVIAPLDEWNEAYYGRAVRPIEIIDRHAVQNPSAQGLRQLVGQATAQGPDPRRSSQSDAGATGYDLATIQRLLAERGFDPGPADGVFGPRTEAAIRAYQRSLGQPVTGEPTLTLQRELQGAG